MMICAWISHEDIEYLINLPTSFFVNPLKVTPCTVNCQISFYGKVLHPKCEDQIDQLSEQ